MVTATLILFLVTGCARDEDSFETAKATDTVESYQAFLEEYPNSNLAPLAQERIEAIAFENAIAVDLERSYVDFLQQFPGSHFAAQAKERAATLGFAQTSEADTEDAYLQFARAYPASALADESMKRASELAFQDALEDYSEDAFQRFLEVYSESSLGQSAAKLLDDIKAGRYIATEDTFISHDRLKEVFSWDGEFGAYPLEGGGSMMFQSDGRLLSGAWAWGNLKFPKSVVIQSGGIKLAKGAVMTYPKD